MGVIAGISLLTALLFLIKRRSFSSLIRRFGYYIVMVAAFELYSYILVQIGDVTNNLYLVHLFTFLEFILVGWFFEKFFRLFDWNLFSKSVIFIGALLIILNTLFLESLEGYNSFARSAVHLIFMSCCFIGFYLFTVRNYNFPDRSAIKLILIALLLKFSGSLFIYLFSKQIARLDIETQKNIWLINPSLNLISQIIYLVALVQLVNIVKASRMANLK